MKPLMRMTALAFFLLLIHCATVHGQAESVDVYILSGQSNMQGIGKLGALPAGDLSMPGDVSFFLNGKFVPIKPGQTKTSHRAGEFGPEIGFGQVMGRESGKRKVYLIKLALSGQPLHFGWHGNKWAGDRPAPNRNTFYPGKEAGDANTGNHYRRLLAHCRKALKVLADAKIPCQVKGFAWMQGEQDAKHAQSAAEYAPMLKLLKQRLAEDLGVQKLPMVYGQVLPHRPALPRFTDRPALRRSQANADAGSGHVDAIPNTAMVPTEGMPLLKDTVHYDARGQLMLGRAMGEAMVKLCAKEKAPAQGGPKIAGTSRPNIIYILVDDMGYGDLGCFGQAQLTTPHLDRMAATGLRFTNHYAGSTVCAPSRCVLMTGLHTGHCTVRSNGNVKLGKNEATVAKVLKKAGYRTGCIGKWGVGRPGLNDPNEQGFDYFYGYVCMNHAHNCYPEFVIRNGRKVPLRNVLEERWKTRNVPDGAGVADKKVDFVPHLCQREVLQFIDRNKEKPFFLYYALNIPHANNEGGKDGMEVPSYGEFADKPWPAAEKGFAAMIRYIDDYVKAIQEKLKVEGLDRNTLVMFTSDNGPHQEGGHKMSFFDSNGPLRGMKRDLYEGGVRVPTIAWWPGVIKGGRESGHLSGFQDMMPTFAELAGVACPKNDGLSLLPTLLGKGKQAKHDHLYWEFYEQGGKQAVLKGKWKGIRLNTHRKPDGPIALYDVTKDIEERKNVAAQHPDIVSDMARIMKEAHTPPE